MTPAGGLSCAQGRAGAFFEYGQFNQFGKPKACTEQTLNPTPG